MSANDPTGTPTPVAEVLGQVELRHLVALRAVAAERSFGRAATRLGYTQSAISQQIAALERAVGEVLFERPGGPKPVALTPAGVLLLAHAEAILDRVAAAEADLAAYRAGRVGHLTIGTFQSVSVELLPPLLTRLRHERPDITVSLVEEDEQANLLRALTAGELDLSFVVAPVDDGPYDFIALADDPFVVISSADEPLTPDGVPVPADVLDGLPLIGQSLTACQILIEDGMRQVGAEPNVVFRTTDNSAVQAMVRSGMAHAVTARLAIDPTDPGIVVRRVDPPIPDRTIGLAVPHRHRSPAVDVVVDLARDVCADVMVSHAPLPA
ncbi:MAG: LysR family transcriptional regulator [Acidimicrobiales bacterium]|nr:LysR family transcriptional regulator [Acidimicrobiales bacterium]